MEAASRKNSHFHCSSRRQSLSTQRATAPLFHENPSSKYTSAYSPSLNTPILPFDLNVRRGFYGGNVSIFCKILNGIPVAQVRCVDLRLFAKTCNTSRD